jgi:hypothetical protein
VLEDFHAIRFIFLQHFTVDLLSRNFVPHFLDFGEKIGWCIQITGFILFYLTIRGVHAVASEIISSKVKRKHNAVFVHIICIS